MQLDDVHVTIIDGSHAATAEGHMLLRQLTHAAPPYVLSGQLLPPSPPPLLLLPPELLVPELLPPPEPLEEPPPPPSSPLDPPEPPLDVLLPPSSPGVPVNAGLELLEHATAPMSMLPNAKPATVPRLNSFIRNPPKPRSIHECSPSGNAPERPFGRRPRPPGLARLGEVRWGWIRLSWAAARVRVTVGPCGWGCWGASGGCGWGGGGVRGGRRWGGGMRLRRMRPRPMRCGGILRRPQTLRARSSRRVVPIRRARMSMRGLHRMRAKTGRSCVLCVGGPIWGPVVRAPRPRRSRTRRSWEPTAARPRREERGPCPSSYRRPR